MYHDNLNKTKEIYLKIQEFNIFINELSLVLMDFEMVDDKTFVISSVINEKSNEIEKILNRVMIF